MPVAYSQNQFGRLALSIERYLTKFDQAAALSALFQLKRNIYATFAQYAK